MKADPRIKTLPKWAQEHIRHLEMEREQAIRTLNQFQDSQTPGMFWMIENPCTGEDTGPTEKRSYIRARWINIQWETAEYQIGVDLHKRLVLRCNNGILILGMSTSNDVELIPDGRRRG